jgi:hypothetical protein
MNTLRIISDKSRYVVAALLVAFSVFVPVVASAEQLTDRSIEMSTSTKGATANYNIQFTATTGAGSAVIDFCDNSPLLGQSCNTAGPLAGFSLTSATVGGGFTKDAASTATKLVVTGTISAGTVTIPVTGVTNPSAAGSIYARIVTYSGTGATAYTSAAPGAHADDGSVALSITEGIAVSGDVLESLTFCVSGGAIADNCSGTITAPTLKLGEDLGNGVIALSPTTVSSDNVYTQIGTNAVGGAIVSLKSSTTDCGGLVRAGAADNTAGCGIKPALLADVFSDASTNKALFGVKTTTATDGTGGEGDYEPVGDYGNTNYLMNYASGNATGVTSAYGDQFLTTNGAPALNKNMMLTFGAQAGNNTPAGSYSTNISLIATGKF